MYKKVLTYALDDWIKPVVFLSFASQFWFVNRGKVTVTRRGESGPEDSPATLL